MKHMGGLAQATGNSVISYIIVWIETHNVASMSHLLIIETSVEELQDTTVRGKVRRLQLLGTWQSILEDSPGPHKKSQELCTIFFPSVWAQGT